MAPERMQRSLARAGQAAIAAVLALAAANWVGWAAGIEELTRGFASWPQMTPWSALLVAALAVAVLALSSPTSATLAGAGSGIASAVGILAVVFLLEYAFSWSSGLDQLWFSESVRTLQATWPGRPSPQTALSVLLLSAAVALTRLDRWWTPVTWWSLLSASAATPFVVIAAYWLESLSLVRVTGATGMGISTALAVQLLVSAVFVVRADRNPVAWLLARPDGWTLALLVAVLAGPPVLIGFFRLALLHAGLHEDASWVLSIAASTAILGAAAFYLSQRGHRELVRGQEKLLEAQERVRSIVLNAPAAISISGSGGNYEMVNQAFCDLFGLSNPDEAVGRRSADLLPPEVAAAMRGAEERALGGECTRVEHGVSVGGARLTFDAEVFPLDALSRQGQVPGVGVIRTDVTERKRVERRLRERQDFEDYISKTITEGKLLVYSQPIVCARTHELVEEELLVRIEGPEGELVSPGEFLPQAQRFGLMPVIDRFMVARAVELARSGRPVAVNLSAASIGDAATMDWIIDALCRAGNLEGRVSFEITEHAALGSIPAAERLSSDMRELGCRLALDDFGTGFGTFTELRNLALHSVKIDMSFVQGLLTDTRDESVVRMIVNIAAEFGLVTTAEGVEDAETLVRLIELGVDQVQGYLIAAPAPAMPTDRNAHASP